MSNPEEQIKLIEQELAKLADDFVGNYRENREENLKKAVENFLKDHLGDVDHQVTVSPKPNEPGVYVVNMSLPKWLADELEADKA